MDISEPLWTSNECEIACGRQRRRPWYADGVQTEASSVLPGDLYIALELEGRDDEEELATAFSRGAVAAIVPTSSPASDIVDDRMMAVPDMEATIASLARYARLRAPMQTVAISGARGNRTLTAALVATLGSTGPVHSARTSGEADLARTMIRLARGTRFGIFDLGLEEAASVQPAARLMGPDIAVLTGIGADMEDTADAETRIAAAASLVEALPADRGTTIVAADMPGADRLISAALATGRQVITVSVDPASGADIAPSRIKECWDCTCVTVDVLGTPVTFKVAAPGRIWAISGLIALTVAVLTGADVGQAALALASVQPIEGRGRHIPLSAAGGHMLMIDHSAGLEAAELRDVLKSLTRVPMKPGGRRIALLADPDGSPELSLVGAMVSADLSRLFALGDRVAEAGMEAETAVERVVLTQRLAERVISVLRPGDVLLVCGGAGIGLGAVVAELVARCTVDDDHLTLNLRLAE
ncbi:Mur ligase family protein [Pseudokordiimonas caeni]|uniref:Mur ligase family protein n=1 Tax=Pseudokordiimonas caeni TaxID=2997908 RepID=UPI00281109F2|nr:Mur ligase family protein [Pseudokordiimonas caeni]